MQKQLIITVFIILGTLTSYAQNKGQIEIGGGLGINSANVSTIDGQANVSSRVAFNIGIFQEYYFSDRWGLKTKLIYDKKGWSDGFINLENGYRVITDFRLNYITLPIMANWHFSSNRNWYLNFGPYIGFLINAKDSELGIDLNKGFRSTDFGLTAGIGYKFKIKDNIKLYVEYESQAGIINIFKRNNGDFVRNTRTSFNIGTIFDINSSKAKNNIENK